MGKSKDKQAELDSSVAAMTSAIMAISPVATKAWMDIFFESTRFVADRLQQDVETQKAILACKSPAELLQVQSEFFESAMQQYADQTKRLFEMMSKATETTIKEAQSGHARGYDDVPL